jgi:3',5'-cyclic AMP phosphodiesterase CpdA
VTACAIHISDLHCGARAQADVEDALVATCQALSPAFVIASGDLANRGRLGELQQAKALLGRLSAPTLAVPGNHDIPYAFPARFSRPWRIFEAVFGTTRPVLSLDGVIACGLNSARPWRHQGGRLSPESIEHAAAVLRDAPATALRIVVLHHHLAGAPWRASRKFPLAARDAALEALSAAGAELIVGGHIHQSSVTERHEFTASDGPLRPPVVLATAPGFNRPRPRRGGEAQGLHVIRWSDSELSVETRIWDGASFSPAGRRLFTRGRD